MPYPIDWFNKRIGTTIRRHSEHTDTPSYWPLHDEKEAQHHFELQQHGYWYSVRPQLTTKPDGRKKK